MANRLVSNVYIIDSQLNAVQLPWGDSGNIPKIRVNAIGFYSINSNSTFQLALKNTTNIVANYSFMGTGAGGLWQTMQIDYVGGLEWQDVYVPLLISATGYLYLV